MAAARKSKAKYLVSLDRKHFFQLRIDKEEIEGLFWIVMVTKENEQSPLIFTFWRPGMGEMMEIEEVDFQTGQVIKTYDTPRKTISSDLERQSSLARIPESSE